MPNVACCYHVPNVFLLFCINNVVCFVFLLSTLFSSFLTVLLSVCVLFLSGGASVILSLGLASWCDTVTDHSMRPYR